jgi:hypothetical protein
MRASEIIRKIADVLDAQEVNHNSNTEITNRPAVVDVEIEQPTDTCDIESQAGVNTKSMVAPLQQKLDLMKKMAGVDDCAEPETDELAIIKQNAGIKPAVVAIADEDEPFEG